MSDFLLTIDAEEFNELLLRWFAQNQRALPWRRQRDCYTTLLSEIILQQTQVEQGLPYYLKFVRRFPKLESLAQAAEEEVLQLWAGLGYYARARNLLKCARELVTRYRGKFPETLPEALALPGIGPYTAAVMLSFCYNLPYAAVDGNVLRVMTRVFAIKHDIRLITTQKQIQQIASQIISQQYPGKFNEALMELGALLCRPQNPQCAACPLSAFCRAHQLGRINELPYRSKAPVKKKRRQLVLVFKNKNHFLIVQRPASGLLASMWEFPTITVPHLKKDKSSLKKHLNRFLTDGRTLLKSGRPLRHNYSHLVLDYLPVLITVADKRMNLSEHKALRWLDAPALKKFFLHGAHQNIINKEPTSRWFNS